MPHIVLTRPMDAAQGFADKLVAAGAMRHDITFAPVFDIILRETNISADPNTLLILTSQNAVAVAAQALAPTSFRAVCVGDRTTALAKKVGFDAQCLGANVAEFLAAFPPWSGPILHLRGAHTSGDIVGHLTQAGYDARFVVTYDQCELPWTEPVLDNLKGGTPVVLPLFSQRTAALVCGRITAAARFQCVAISPDVGLICSKHGFKRVAVASQPNGQAMLDLTMAAYAHPSLEAGT